MDLKEMLNLADRVVFAKTGQHLDDLQEAVLRGTLQRETYKQIAKDFDCSESNVRNAGSELWQILSEELGEDVSKSNFRTAMERFQLSIISHLEQHHNQIGSFNICGKTSHSPNLPNLNPLTEETSNSKEPQTLYQDLSQMPELGSFYDRTPELETLQTWIVQHHCRLIALTGICGIGKTTLAVQLVHKIKDEFEYVVWFSLDSSPPFSELEANLLQFFSPSETQDLPNTDLQNLPLIKYLQKHRCLVVLDDIHQLFSSDELAGKYKTGYEEYRSFFKQVEKLSHQSCFLLIGWEQPREVTQTNSENSPVRTLQLGGLDVAAGGEILKEYGLGDSDRNSSLVHCYQGNPFWLKSVASLIQELGECVTELLPNDTLLLPEELKDILDDRFSRLSELEKQVMCLLAKEPDAIALGKLLETGTISPSDLLNALQSLSRRCLLEKQNNSYSLFPIIRQYVNGL